MKNIIYKLTFLLFIAGLWSCEKQTLDLEPLNSENSENYYESDENALKAIISVYRSNNSDMLLLSFGDLPSDDAVKGGSGVSDGLQFQEIADFTATSSNPLIGPKWSQLYEVITRSNEVIGSLEAQATLSDSKKIIIGEAKFLRAFAYSKLVEIFGKVPLLDHVPLFAEFETITRSNTEKEVYDFIKKDLDDAIAILPIKGNIDIGRATKGAAQALKARVALRETGYFYNSIMQNRAPEYSSSGLNVNDLWKEVYDQTLAVMNTPGYALLPNYAEVFEIEGENKSETVYDQQYVNDLTVTGWNDLPGNEVPVRLGVRGFGGWGFNQPKDNLFHEFSRNDDVDPRREVTMLSEEWPVGWGYNIVEDIMAGSQIDEYAWIKADPKYDYSIFKTLRKAVPTTKVMPGGRRQIPTNIRVIRYSDVLLMNAEAAFHLGKEQEARERVNEIRERARNSTFPTGSQIGDVDADGYPTEYRPFTGANLPDVSTTGQALLEDIRHERRVELALEGLRYFDIIRTGELSKLNNEEGYIAKKGLWPLPDSEVTIYNLEQNEGY
ncbi:hypothetical protein B4Q04_14355 [Zobellia sp. OII3]|uniref:RagB/SusD family nutrient uptake outer membrane protein n=1 Tax=Zobellia sp. OII3 TaxID=2034520 RepID=UPI000B533AAE|nr:RagB/SusD family nutrient uptake outer membrane protein [Zobellia sp. OII3]OWW24495.1 hypothetical protein B4Q04_14355 [Zobellia sp. OII3]